MQKKIRDRLLVLVLITFINNAHANKEIIFIERMMMSNSVNKTELNTGAVKSSNWFFSNEDKKVIYYASIGVINPQKKQYDVNYICIDNKGGIIIQGALKMDLSKLEESHLGKDIMRRNQLITFVLAPQINTLAKNQLTSLTDNNNYYVKLYVDKKLIGLTKFHYEIW